MIGRREGPLMRNNTHSLQKSKVLFAISIGVFIGCVFAFVFPNGFFASNSIPRRSFNLVGSKIQVQNLIFMNIDVVSFFFLFGLFCPLNLFLGIDFIDMLWDYLNTYEAVDF